MAFTSMLDFFPEQKANHHTG